MKFIHAADLHLDSPFKGLKSMPEKIWQSIYQSTFQSLSTIVSLAIDKEVDFVCIAGDIYDAEDRSVKAQAYFKKEMERLDNENIPVFLLHGNHDFIDQGGLQLNMPENVLTFGTEIETKEIITQHQERVAVTGFSYGKRWVNERKAESYPPRKKESDYHIGMLHGFQEGNSSTHQHYAPFSLAELKSKQYDYWALGHIHKRAVLDTSPFIVYAGNTQGRHRNESGAKGCYLVELNKGEQHATFYPTAPIEWHNQVVSLKGKKTLQEVYESLQEVKKQQTKSGKNVLLSIILEQTNDLLEGVFRKIKNGDLLEGIQKIPEEKNYVWPIRLEIREKKTSKLPSLTKLFPEEWKLATSEVLEESQFNTIVQTFYETQSIGSHLSNRDEQYRKKILQMAKNEISHQLGYEKENIDENNSD